MLKKTKLFTHAVKSIDEETRQATFVISTDEKDRMGEVVEQSWDLENYKKNPIVLFGHDPSKPGYVLGKATEIVADKDGDKNITLGTVQFAEEGTSQDADTVWKLVKQGILRTVSVGFIPHTFKKLDEDGETDVLADNELLEFSIVPIPANPSAVALALGDGSIEEKDAKYMLKAYRQEATFIEKSLCDIMTSNKTDGNSKSRKEDGIMSDEDIAKIAEAVGTAVSEAIAPKLDEILAKVSDEEGDSEDKPEEEPAEEPMESEGNELAEDDKPEDDESDDESDDDEDKEKEKSIAKSEQVDEDGAFDENEELDEEAEKSFLADLEKEYQEQNNA